MSHSRIPVATQLNVYSWIAHLADYDDQQLLNYIEFSFLLDFDKSRLSGNTEHTFVLILMLSNVL